MKIVNQSVEILDDLDTERIMKKLEVAGRTCYQSDPRYADQFLRGIIKSGHESVLEHEAVTVRFVTDRATANQIVRHRISSISQESQRYCNYTKERFDGQVKFVYPIDSSLEHRNLLSDAYLQMEHSYNRLIKHGATPEQARFALGNGAATTLIVTMNIRMWRHFFKLRTALDAQTDVRYLADSLLGDFKEYLPVLFEDIEVSDAT